MADVMQESHDRLQVLAWVRHAAESGLARTIRETARLTGAELAAEVDVDPSTLWRWEMGKARPRGPAAERWAAVLARLQEVAP